MFICIIYVYKMQVMSYIFTTKNLEFDSSKTFEIIDAESADYVIFFAGRYGILSSMFIQLLRNILCSCQCSAVSYLCLEMKIN